MAEQGLAAVRAALAANEPARAWQLARALPEGDPQTDYLRGLSACAAGDLVAGRADLERAAAALPSAVEVQAHLLHCLLGLGAFVEALRCASERVQALPHAAILHALHGQAALQSGQVGVALAACEHAVRLQPELALAWLWLARAQRERGEARQALHALERLMRLSGAIEHRIEHAETLIELGEAERARRGLESLLRHQPALPAIHLALIRALVQLRQPLAALPHALRAIELAPDAPEVLAAHSLVLRLCGRTVEAAVSALRATELRFAPDANPWPLPRELRDTTAAKLLHDAEQLEYLLSRGLDVDAELASDLRRALSELEDAEPTRIQPLPAASASILAGRYNRLHVHRPPAAVAGSTLNPALDGPAIERAYRERAPGIVWIDGLLRPDALEALYQYCLESTLWFDFRHAGGYLGALFENGFAAPLLLQLVENLRALLPELIGTRPLTQLWAFKYDHRLQGIDIHADVAEVNVNFWLTPDAANLDPDSGGLELWDQVPPPEWSFGDFNSAGPAHQKRIREFLAASRAQSVRVPYRRNRAVIFNSELFHRTDQVRFAPGYAHRRLNLTLLFGQRAGLKPV